MSLILLIIHALSVDSPKPVDCLHKLFIGGLQLQVEFFSYVIEKSISQGKTDHDKIITLEYRVVFHESLCQIVLSSFLVQ